jgi:HK97 family phage major capsid protein
MPDLALLTAEMDEVTTARAELRSKNPGAVMPDEARQQDAVLVDRMQRVQSLIAEEQQKERDRIVADTARFLDEPRNSIPKAVNADDTGRKTLLNAGWDIRGGTVYRNTARGEVAFLPEAVLFGPMPSDDPVAAKHFRTMRAVFQPEYKAAWVKYLANRGNLAALSGQEQNALSEGTASEGGYTVPADVQAEMFVRRRDASVIRSLARTVQTSRDRIQFPAVTAHGSSGSVYSSAFVGGMVGERVVNSDAGPTFQQFEISIKKFEVYTKLTNDLIADSGSDLLAFLASDGGGNLGLVEDNMFINGVGTGLEPAGILSYSLTTFDVEGSTSNNISNTVSNAGSAPKIIAGAYTLPAQYAERATWLMSRQSQGEIHGLVDADGRPWWQLNAGAGGAAGAPPTLVNIPVRTSPFMPIDNTDTNKVLLLGDFSAYIIADRTSMTVQVDPINGIGTDETSIYIRSRAGGGLWNTDAFRVGVV